MIKILLSTLMLLLPLLASAQDYEATNADRVTIYYNYINGGAALEVTACSYAEKPYSGIVNIPEEVVTYHGTTLPVTRIGDNAFKDCSGLTSVTIPNSVTTIGESAFYQCTGLVSVTIPNSVTTIANWAFYNCSSMNSLTIGNSVTTIGESAFNFCNYLSSLTIPSSVTSIGRRAFYNCNNLKKVNSKMLNPCDIDADCFTYNVFNTAKLYIPYGTWDLYTTMYYWNKFRSFTQVETCATPTIGYADKKLKFSCETEGVEYVSEIKIADAKKSHDAEVNLSATYEISVYATKSDYWESNVATATLVWTNATLTGAETIATLANAPTERVPVLISSRDGNLLVTCELEGQPVSVYSIDGKALGSARVKGGQAIIATNLPTGEIVIVKMGDRSVKVKM